MTQLSALDSSQECWDEILGRDGNLKKKAKHSFWEVCFGPFLLLLFRKPLPFCATPKYSKLSRGSCLAKALRVTPVCEGVLETANSAWKRAGTGVRRAFS